MSGKRSASSRRSASTTRATKRRANDEEPVQEDAQMADAEEVEFEDDFSDIEDDGEVVDGGSDAEEDDGEADDPARRVVFRPGIDEMPEGAELTYDSSAYDMFHKLVMDWPCLSFDVVTDSHGASRTKYPLTTYFAAGTQAASGEQNNLSMMKASQLCRTRYDDEDADDDAEHDDDDDDEDEADGDLEPLVEQKKHASPTAYNRVRVMPQQPTIVAGWTEAGIVTCHDFSDQFKQLDNPTEWVRENAQAGGAKAGRAPPLLFSTPHSSEGHTIEGYGIGWSPLKRGVLATGDCEGSVRSWTLNEAGGVASAKLTTTPCPGSIEDIKWSSVQENVFICAQAGGTCQVFDARSPNAKLTWVACQNGVDVNVLDWNQHKRESHQLATGHDDGSFCIWDLRMVMKNPTAANPVQSYNFLTSAVTSIEWSPTNENLFAVASDDNQVTLWDISVERDAEEEAEMAARHPELAKFPAQLVFQHMGLKSPKELHWHPQIPGVVVVTDQNGFDIFRPSNWKTLVR